MTTQSKSEFTVLLQSYPNPDFGQTAPPSEEQHLYTDTLASIVRWARAYINVNRLGSGNWKSPTVYRHGKPYVTISYNGTVWTLDPKPRCLRHEEI